MANVTTGENAGEQVDRVDRSDPGGRARTEPGRLLLMVGALGVVFGDIGTSPLYAVQSVFSIDQNRVQPTSGDILGVISLILWAIILIVTAKYVSFVLRADNDGEGGVMALAALVRGSLQQADTRRIAVVLGLGALGASLFYGDSVITPSISVLSAVEGLEVPAPSLANVVVPVAATILGLLFVAQRWGTQRVGNFFGPVMLVWFATLGVFGIPEVVTHPSILRSISPTYGVIFLAGNPITGFIAMGAVVLAITGAEALYADLGHFGRSPIRSAWFFIVLPALFLNYLAQGALILHRPAARANPFFMLLPNWAQIPMVVLATAATVIASQAVISGAFSVSRQALRLGFLPHLVIRQTSSREVGQIYVPSVNWALFVAVVAVTLTFRHSARLASAYGVAVTGTFLITTALFLWVAHAQWRWATWKVVLFAAVVGGAEIIFFSANLIKVVDGGWLTLLIALCVFTTMLTWKRGREIVTERRNEKEGSLQTFIDSLPELNPHRVPGLAVFPHPTKETTPLALRANVERNHVLHECVVIISGRTANVPHIGWSKRLTVDNLGDPNDGIIHVSAEFGFQDRMDFPQVLRRVVHMGIERRDSCDPKDATYFVSRITLQPTKRPGMARWRKAVFNALAHNAASQAEYLMLPLDRTIVMGEQIDF